MSMGKVIPSEVVDHIIPRNLGGAMYSRVNLMPMTKFWHDRKTQIEVKMMADIDTNKIKGGLVPASRQAVIDYILDFYKNEVKDILDGEKDIL